MPDYILTMLEEKGIAYSLHETIEEVIPQLDILYMTRVQKERLDPPNTPTLSRSSFCAPRCWRERAIT